MNIKYRPEIDGLRTIAVFSVIIFHAGYLPNGYLGVDIFFVISGYLITGIIWKDIVAEKFSISNFYERRIRRIIPLMLVISSFSYLLGWFFLLPDDFENLCQSIIATVFFSNNLLLFLTSGYWNIVNEYKPLMHTWSLGVEEQFYFIYPLILILFSKISRKKLFAVLIAILFVSFISNLLYTNNNFNFFSVTSRFWQLSLGGLASIFTSTEYFKNISKHKNLLQVIGNVSFAIILLFLISFIPKELNGIWLNLGATLSVVSLILFSNNSFLLKFLYNKSIVFIGKLSFSIYLWHQLVFVYFRINSLEDLSIWKYCIAILVTVALSLLTYYFIETPFRNKEFIRKGKLYVLLIFVSGILLSCSYYAYKKSGIIRNYPELGLLEVDKHTAGENAEYNDRIYKMDIDFKKEIKTRKILVIGNSFGRDFVNMLIENHFNDTFQISYIYKNNFDFKKYHDRLIESDVIIISGPSKESEYNGMKESFLLLKEKYSNMNKKFFFVGTKNFGKNSNAFFNTSNSQDRCKLRTALQSGYFELNNLGKRDFNNEYIDVLGLIIDSNKMVPVFTDDCKLISQDCEHLTKFGAKFLGEKLNTKYKLNALFKN